jgi:GT2 family glycosyltransferase
MDNYKNKVTFIACTCKRLNCFFGSMDNFFKNCLDHHLIKEFIIIDDNSSDADREAMKEKYPDFKFILKNPEQKGHSKSLNMIPDLVETKYFLNWEDDTEFLHPKNYVTDAINILESDQANDLNIKQVLFNDSGFSYSQQNDPDLQFDAPVPFMLHLIKDESLLPESVDTFIVGLQHWPGYSDNAFIMHTSIVKELGYFIEEPSTSEVDFSLKFRKKGYRTCFLKGAGLKWNSDISAYTMNGEQRWWDYYYAGVELKQIKYILTHIFEIKTWKIIWNLLTGKI